MVERSEELTHAAAPVASTAHSYTDWQAIAAGAVVATAIAFIFSTFGAALGLATVSPYEGEGMGATFTVIAVGIWMLWTTASSFMAGGYIAGRMRRRVDDASADEISIRDGCHGLAVWGVGVIIGALMLGAAIGTTARVAGSAAETAVQAAGSVVEGAGQAVSGAGSALSDLVPENMRSNPLSQAASRLIGQEAGMPPEAQERLEDQAGSILANVIQDGELNDQDRQYLVQVLTQNSNLSEQEINTRIDQAVQQVQQARQAAMDAAQKAKDEAAEAADVARQYSVVSAFILSAALLIAGAAAYWAAGLGGRHRDEGRVFSSFSTWH
jgi:hypothetical protein